eukprot:1332779-Amorphochlora_amoeboformis.AAC.1
MVESPRRRRDGKRQSRPGKTPIMKARGEETMNSSWMTVTIAGAIAISDLVVHAVGTGLGCTFKILDVKVQGERIKFAAFGANTTCVYVCGQGVFFGGGSSLTRELEEFDFHTKTVDLLGFALARTVIATALIIFIATNGVFQWSLLGKIAVSLCMIGSLGSRGHRISSHYTVMPVEPVAVDEGDRIRASEKSQA